MTFDDALRFILRLPDLERTARPGHRPDLVAIRALLERMGNPERGRPTLHIAGSKGKGSTAAIAASILSAAGIRTGLYTSPHLHSFCERIAIDGLPISEALFAQGVARMAPLVEATNREVDPREVSTFEMLTALAFDTFRLEGVGAQVIEVGLGGTNDATDVVEPTVAAITAISLEHTRILGSTVGAIAVHKAGIIERGAHLAVTAPQDPSALAVIRARAAEQGVPLLELGRDVIWEIEETSERGERFRLTTPRQRYDLWLPLLGAHQVENAAVAVASVEGLAAARIQVPPEAVVRGVAAARWPGRLEVLGRDPLVVVDGAHNGDSAARLRAALEAIFPFDRLILVIGISQDKDLAAIAAPLRSPVTEAIATRADHPRAMAADELAGALRAQAIPARAVPSVPAALTEALRIATPRDLVCVMGSLFVAAEALRAFPAITAARRGDQPATPAAAASAPASRAPRR